MRFDTPQEFVAWVESIKDRLHAMVTNRLVPAVITPNERVPLILKRNTVDRNPSVWAARLRSPRHVVTVAGEAQEMVHAFMIGYGGIATLASDAGRTGTTVGSRSYRLRFTIDSYYQEIPGTDDDNSELWHNQEILFVVDKLVNERPFGVPGVGMVERWSESRGLTQFGDTPARESLGECYLDTDPIDIRYQQS